MSVRVVMLSVLVVSALAQAQVVPEREVQIIKALFDAGNYANTLKRADETLGVPGFSDAQRVELFRMAGLSAFNLSDLPGAKQRLLALLQLDPDYVLDPFVVPPPAIVLFEQLRTENAPTLNVIRQMIAMRAEQEKRTKAEEERRRAEAAKPVLVRTIEKRSLLVNFVPFGVGQFAQGRTLWGTVFAVGEGLLAAVSVGAFAWVLGLNKTFTYTLVDRITSNRIVINVRGIPVERAAEARIVGWVQVGSGIAFYAAAIGGIIEALLNHQGDVVTETKAPKLSIYPVHEGAGVSLSFGF